MDGQVENPASGITVVKEPFYKKYAGLIVVALILVCGVFIYLDLKKPKEATGPEKIVKTDTVIAEYITQVYGDLHGGAVLRDSSDQGNIQFRVPAQVDTVRDSLKRIVMDTTTHKPKLKINWLTLLPRYVEVKHISPR